MSKDAEKIEEYRKALMPALHDLWFLVGSDNFKKVSFHLYKKIVPLSQQKEANGG